MPKQTFLALGEEDSSPRGTNRMQITAFDKITNLARATF